VTANALFEGPGRAAVGPTRKDGRLHGAKVAPKREVASLSDAWGVGGHSHTLFPRWGGPGVRKSYLSESCGSSGFARRECFAGDREGGAPIAFRVSCPWLEFLLS
jgi:hypothetical protein